MTYSTNKRITCQQAQYQLDARILSDPSLTIKDRKSIGSHLQNCPKCVQKCEKAGLVMNLVKKNWPGKTENQLIIERTERAIEHRMTAKEGLKDLLRQCPDHAVTVKHQKLQRLLQRVNAVAACLIIGISLFLACSGSLKPESARGSISQQAHASKYLAETRSLIWFAVTDGRHDSTVEERAEVLVLLQEEVIAACNCQNDMLSAANEQQSSCDDRC
jgi:hypothetical protein